MGERLNCSHALLIFEHEFETSKGEWAEEKKNKRSKNKPPPSSFAKNKGEKRVVLKDKGFSSSPTWLQETKTRTNFVR